MSFIKKIFERKKKKKTYVADNTDWTALAYWIFIFSVGGYLILRSALNVKVALPILLGFPAMVGIIFILFFLPIKLFTFIINEITLKVHLYHIPKKIPSDTVIVIGKNEYRKPSFWTSPNYDMGLVLMVKYLRLMGRPFSIYHNTDIATLDKIMENKEIKTVYMVGHGRRHGFVMDKGTVVDYCRYNDPKFKKDYVYQIHCNHGKGTTLVEYVVPKENQAECMPEHGYMSNITVANMFIDKILQHQNYGKIKTRLMKLGYNFLILIIPILVIFSWGYIFSKMVT
jgi:hypothetical protein